MNTDGHRWRKGIRKIFLGVFAGIFIYIVSYALSSLLGGYWLKPEMDGHDRYSFGLAMPTACMWQPRFGHGALGGYDFLGTFYKPLIRLDRHFVHPTIYLSDEGFIKITGLPVSKVHPYWRDDFATKITITPTRDETKKVLRCVFRYSGSDKPREIIEVKMMRELADALAISPPNGFVPKPHESRDQFLNTNYVHWVGRLTLVKNQDVILEFPAQQPNAGAGSIGFYYQRTDGTTDSKGFCSVDLK